MQMDFDAWVDRIESLHPASIKLGFERLHSVANRLGELRPAPCVVTVAGSNGKGSCIAALQGMALCAGVRVGTYTSPHLLCFRERLQINGVPLGEDDWCMAFRIVEHAREDTPLTFFEFTTLAALWLLQRSGVQLALLEIGLGGRLDAVNLVDPDLAILSSVDLEHCEWLGADRESIGAEKSAIFRPGKIAVCAEREPPDSVLCAGKHTEFYRLGVDFDFSLDASGWQWHGGAHGVPVSLHESSPPRLAAHSVAAAFQAWFCLYPEHSDAEILCAGLNAELAGRRQRLRHGKKNFLLDVAHNPAAAQYLCSFLHRGTKRYAVFSMLSDKDAEGFARAVAPMVHRWYLVGLNIPRAMPVDRLKQAVCSAGGVCAGCYDSVAEALHAATEYVEERDEILVTGSFYMVADALALLNAA